MQAAANFSLEVQALSISRRCYIFKHTNAIYVRFFSYDTAVVELLITKVELLQVFIRVVIFCLKFNQKIEKICD